MSDRVLSLTHTHVYPGARGVLHGAGGTGPCRIEFADGVETSGGIAETPDGAILSVAGHVTARGARIAAKRWVLEVQPAASGARVKVLRRLPDDA